MRAFLASYFLVASVIFKTFATSDDLNGFSNEDLVLEAHGDISEQKYISRRRETLSVNFDEVISTYD